MRLYVLLFVSAFVLCSARSADACDCVSVPIVAGAERLNPEWKGILAVGRVIALRLVNKDGAPTNVVAVEVDVSETLRNATPGRLTLYTHVFGASCYGYDFRIGREYLISTTPIESLDRDREFLPHLLPPGSQVVALCGGTAELATRNAQESLKRLRAAFRRR